MTRLIGRFAILLLLSAAVAWAVWLLALQRNDVQLGLYARAAELRFERLATRPSAPGELRASVCDNGACVFVQAGAETLLIGSAAGAAQALAEAGWLRPNLGAVLLTSASHEPLAGLADLSSALARAGRTAPIKVFAPEAADREIVAAEAYAAGVRGGGVGKDKSDAALLHVVVRSAPTASPALIFESANLQVRAVGALRDGGQRIYRIDYAGSSMIVAGCAARATDIAGLSKGRGKSLVATILPAVSREMIASEAAAAKAAGLAATPNADSQCLTAEEAASALLDAGVKRGMLYPLAPIVRDTASRRTWEALTPHTSGLRLVPGLPGARIALEAPSGGLATAAPGAPGNAVRNAGLAAEAPAAPAAKAIALPASSKTQVAAAPANKGAAKAGSETTAPQGPAAANVAAQPKTPEK